MSVCLVYKVLTRFFSVSVGMFIFSFLDIPCEESVSIRYPVLLICGPECPQFAALSRCSHNQGTCLTSLSLVVQLASQ